MALAARVRRASLPVTRRARKATVAVTLTPLKRGPVPAATIPPPASPLPARAAPRPRIAAAKTVWRKQMERSPVAAPPPRAPQVAASPHISVLRSLARDIAGRGGDLALALTLSALAFSFLHAALLSSVAAGEATALLTERMPLHLPLQRTVADRPVQSFLSVLLRLPEVQGVTFVTKEQQYERQRRLYPDDLPFLERYIQENPLADTAVVTLRSLRDTDAFLGFLKRPVFQSVLDPAFPWAVRAWQKDLSDALLRSRTVHILLLGAVALGALLVLASALSATRLRFARFRGHVAWQERSGEEPLLIRQPFMLEAGALLLAGALLSTLLLSGCAALLFLLFPAASVVLPLPLFSHAFSWLLFADIALVAGGVLLAAFLPLDSHGTQLHLRGSGAPHNRGRRG